MGNKNSLKINNIEILEIGDSINSGRYIDGRISICKYLEQKYKIEPGKAEQLEILKHSYINCAAEAVDDETRAITEKVVASFESMLIKFIKDIMGAEDFNILEILEQEI